jgi:phytoene desaturase
MLHLRPNNRFEDLDGVYLAGGGTHPGSGLPVIFEGARISAAHLLNDRGLDASTILPRRSAPDSTAASLAAAMRDTA